MNVKPVKQASQWQKIIPNSLSLFRLAAGAGLLVFVSPPCRFDVLLYIYLLLVITDLMDGWLARRWGVCTRTGFYLDACADFAAVSSGLVLFVRCGVFPPWIPVLTTAVFVLFIITAHMKTNGYDPLGKYFGAWIYLVLLGLLALPDCAWKIAVASPAIAIAAAAVLVSRTIYLLTGSRA